MIDGFAFKRENLAKAYCDSLAGKGIVNSASGLFLAGPRRVGKSTFLVEDLIPEAKARGWLAVYIDLWGNKQSDPALLITDAIKASIGAHQGKFGKLGKLVKKIKPQKVNILNTIELDFSKQGLPDSVTLVDALSHLINLSSKPVLLIVDEAQHALTTKAGLNAMFSIKSARDQINRSYQSPTLMLAFTGSNRDKLAQLVIKKDQPFFGSSVTSFPLLGKEFTDFFCEKANKALAKTNQFSKEGMWEAFQLIGHRPEILRQIVGYAAINNEAASFSDLLKRDALVWHNQICEEFERDFRALPALHRVILVLLVKKNLSWSPFSEDSMQFYKEEMHQESLPISTVQTAIKALRDQGFIWQSSRGSYALEDESFAEWLKHTVIGAK